VKNLIYQYWDGELTPGCIAGTENMKKYAGRIGADYLFEHNPRFVTNLGRYSPHYGSFKPVYDESFHKYDNILFTDTDVFAMEGLEESIFENFSADIGICTEPFQPLQRLNVGGQITGDSDEQWAAAIKSRWNADMPRTPEGLLKVYNSGVVMYSNKGLVNAKEKFVPFTEYVNVVNSNRLKTFYTADQNYLHAMLTVANMDYVELDNGWNSYIHQYHTDASKTQIDINDSRTDKSKFVHIQLRSADHWDADTLERITNLPQDKWNIK
jgi:hypothetical protein